MRNFTNHHTRSAGLFASVILFFVDSVFRSSSLASPPFQLSLNFYPCNTNICLRALHLTTQASSPVLTSAQYASFILIKQEPSISIAMVYRLALAAAGLLSANIVSAQTGTGTKCGENNLCPSSIPCCSREYYRASVHDPMD